MPTSSFSRARFTDDDPAGDRIPGALDRVISGGVTVEPQPAASSAACASATSARGRSSRTPASTSKSTTLWNGEVGYRFSSRARLVLEVFNLFDAKVSDIDYFYTSRLPGEPADGVEDVHTHPALPRSARVGLQLSF